MTAAKMYDFLRQRGVFRSDQIFLAAPQHVRDALEELAEDAGVAGVDDHLDEIDEAVARIRALILSGVAGVDDHLDEIDEAVARIRALIL